VNITAEKISKLENKVVLTLEPADYSTRLEEALKDYRRKVNIPGFRKGMVPAGMVKKMYGKALLYEELNKLVNEQVDQFLKEQALDIFAQPVPEEGHDPFAAGMEEQNSFVFRFDIGLKPEVSVKIPSKTFVKYQVEPDQNLLTNYTNDLRKRYYTNAYPETSEAGDNVFLRLKELDENGELKAGGVVTVSLVKLADIHETSLQAELTGVGKDYSTRNTLTAIFGTDKEKIASGIKKTVEELATINEQFEITVSNILRDGLADMNTDFFKQVFGNENIDTEEAFYDRIKLELGRALQTDAERLLRNELMEELLDADGIELPDSFLMRWLRTASENPIDEHTLQTQYPDYAKQLRRDLIIDQILKEQNLQIESEEIMNEARGLLYRQFSSYGIPIEEKDLNKYALDYLKKDDNYANLYYSLKFRKVEDYVREHITVEEKPLAFAEFEKLTQKKTV